MKKAKDGGKCAAWATSWNWMLTFERRIVHQAIKDDPGYSKTHSVEVEGTDKKVILRWPKRASSQARVTPCAVFRIRT